ncbi:MAG: hypothetical protein NVS1B7_0700 [Candidatus Saccharimonadales bacterium]
MKKSVAGIALAIISVGIIAGIYFTNKNHDSNANKAVTMDMQTPTTSGNSKSNADSSQVKSGKVSINIQDFSFQPAKMKIKVGSTITWTNKDAAHHDIAPDMENPDFVGSGHLLGKGESYSYTFQKAGTFTYHCTPHPYMKASVEVVE